MGTIVLPPQDCLSSPHNRQNSYLSSARSNIGRSSFQAAMVLSPTAEDCARHRHSGGSPPGDGLLPIPAIHGQSRILSSKGSPPAKALPPFCSPHLHRMHSGPSPSVKSNISRSASAILPTPLVGSPPLAEGLLKGRLPFKIVQGNGPGNNNDSLRANPSKKPKEVRSGVRNGTTAANNHTSNKKASRNFDNLKSTIKVSQNGDGGIQGQFKNADVRLRKSLERSNLSKGACEKGESAEFPVVTILQRPETEEAAAELFAKFFQNGTKQASVYSNEGVEALSFKSANLCQMSKVKEANEQLAGEELSDGESSEGSSCRTGYSSFWKGMTKVQKDVKMLASADAQGSAVPGKVGVLFDGGLLQSTKGPVFETVCEELAPWERWAGPSYINSPPPSALPLPRFSKKHSKVVLVDDVQDEHMDVPYEISTPPSSISPLYASLARQRHLNINLDAVATATKDLKRILNLDLCRV